MSVRNNEERLEARNLNVDSPPPQVESQKIESENEAPQTPLSFTTPTEFVDLPSKGLFYAKNHPLHQKDSVEIRFMTARDEDILTSKSLLKKGIAIDRLLQNVIVDKKINIDHMLIGDKNALIVATRITGYGAEYNTKSMCPACGSTSENLYDLEGVKTVETEIPEGVERTPKGTFVLKAPKSGVTVEMRLLAGVDEKRLAKVMAAKKKKNLPESTLTDQLRLALVSVEGQTEPNLINLFVGSLPAMDARYLREVYAKIMPNVDMKQDFECNSCGFEQEMEVPFTSDFFWPK